MVVVGLLEGAVRVLLYLFVNSPGANTFELVAYRVPSLQNRQLPGRREFMEYHNAVDPAEGQLAGFLAPGDDPEAELSGTCSSP